MSLAIIIDRFAHTDHGTPGRLRVERSNSVEAGYAIELPWRDNAVGRSCIPAGTYNARRHMSPQFGPSIWVKDVDDRTEILFHAANSHSDLDGCIGPGERFGWAGDYWDGVERPARDEFAVWSSARMLDRILETLSDENVERVPVIINAPAE